MKKLKKLLDGPACKGNRTVAFIERGTVDRQQLGPFVRAYLSAMLEQFTDKSIKHISERLIQQCIRDCVNFYHRNSNRLPLFWDDPFGDYSEADTGREFWYSRHGQGANHGFSAHVELFDTMETQDYMRWMALEASALINGPVLPLLFENPRGEIDINYEANKT